MNKLDVWGRVLFGAGESNGGQAPLSPFLEQMWRRSGRPNPGSAEAEERDGFVFWYIRHFYRRGGQHWKLPPALLAWLNAPAAGSSVELQEASSPREGQPNTEPQFVSRYMKHVWQLEGERFQLKDRESFFEFLTWYAFRYMPEHKVPAALLPDALLEQLNRPASEERVPLTVGMQMWEKLERPDHFQQLVEGTEARRYAICYELAREILANGNPRLVPSFISGFWRSFAANGDTAFDYVTSRIDARSPVSSRLPVELPLAQLFSKPTPIDGPAAQVPASRPHELSIVSYRDQHTICGLGKAGGYAVEALRSAGLEIIDLDYNIGRKNVKEESFYNGHIFNNSRRSIHVFNLNPEHVLDCAMCNLSRLRENDYFIGQFYWELSDICAIHEATLGLMDEIWAASEFLADVYRRRVNVPVINMGTVVAPNPLEKTYSRSDFGLRDGDYLFLLNFDAGSIVERKNPLAAVEAFKAAFPRGNEKAGLVIKTRNVSHIGPVADRKNWERTAKAIAQDRRITVIDATLPDDGIAGLYSVTDCYVSLHRSEGFGYGPAEALYWGKPVIVTAFSGVCDFCTESTAKLVDYELTAVKPGQYPWVASEGSHFWAQPNVSTASRHMRTLYEDPLAGSELGKQGQRVMQDRYSARALAQRYMARLKELGVISTS